MQGRGPRSRERAGEDRVRCCRPAQTQSSSPRRTPVQLRTSLPCCIGRDKAHPITGCNGCVHLLDEDVVRRSGSVGCSIRRCIAGTRRGAWCWGTAFARSRVRVTNARLGLLRTGVPGWQVAARRPEVQTGRGPDVTDRYGPVGRRPCPFATPTRAWSSQNPRFTEGTNTMLAGMTAAQPGRAHPRRQPSIACRPHATGRLWSGVSPQSRASRW
jgi:hypothetical protein